MSSDAKVWKDTSGWHGISDWHDHEIVSSEYALTDILTEIEDKAGQPLDWDIFEFGNGLALRGYKARPSGK